MVYTPKDAVHEGMFSVQNRTFNILRGNVREGTFDVHKGTFDVCEEMLHAACSVFGKGDIDLCPNGCPLENKSVLSVCSLSVCHKNVLCNLLHNFINYNTAYIF